MVLLPELQNVLFPIQKQPKDTVQVDTHILRILNIRRSRYLVNKVDLFKVLYIYM